MGFSSYFKIILGVISDWRVIITVIAMLFVISFAKFVASYKKRAPRPKVKKGKKAAEAPKPKKEAKKENTDQEGDDQASDAS